MLTLISRPDHGMIRTLRFAFTALLIVHFGVSTACASLRDDVERLVRTASLKGGTAAVSICDADTGLALVSINEHRAMTPASNMKLLTTGAALHALGPNFQFTTRLLRDGDRLIILGDGDPAFGDPDLLADMLTPDGRRMNAEEFLRLWIKPVVEAGMMEVSEIVIDDRIFDREFIHHAWPADQLNNRYCAQVAGLNFHGNVLQFYPKPRPGQPPVISDCRPAAGWLKITNAASSKQGKGDQSNTWIARKPLTNELTFRGNVRFAYKSPVEVTLHGVPDFFGRLLAERLEQAGVEVGAHRVSTPDDPASKGEVLGPVITTPLSTVLIRCNRDSENLYAESLLKRIGHALTGEPGSWINGGAILRHVVHERLNDPTLAGGIIVSDGSGLSAENKITAAAMTAWLNSFHNDEKLGPIFRESLAIAGQTGTLKNRYDGVKLHGATVRAKTGYINHVSCLSGFITMPDGRCRSFSILVNGFPAGGVSHAKKLQDQIVASIAEDLAASTVQLGSD